MEESSSTLTRTPVVEEKAEISLSPREDTVKETTPDGSEPTPNELVNLGRPPYLVDLLNARMAYETFDVKEQIGEIDEFIRDGLEDSRASYENAFNGLKAHIKETGDIYTDLAQLRDYVRLQQKIKGIIKEKEEFEAKSPEDMGADELKRFLTEHGTRRY